MLLKINKVTAAKGQQKLLQEFDYFDQILLNRQQQSSAQNLSPSTATNAEVDSYERPSQQLPYYLCGDHLSAADISLASLGGYIVEASYEVWQPALDDLPDELKSLIKVCQLVRHMCVVVLTCLVMAPNCMRWYQQCLELANDALYYREPPAS